MRLILVGLEMSKVLHLLDWNDLLSYRHEKWIVAEMKEQEEVANENTNEENGVSEKEKFDNYVNPDGNESFSYDDIPF